MQLTVRLMSKFGNFSTNYFTLQVLSIFFILFAKTLASVVHKDPFLAEHHHDDLVVPSDNDLGSHLDGSFGAGVHLEDDHHFGADPGLFGKGSDAQVTVTKSVAVAVPQAVPVPVVQAVPLPVDRPYPVVVPKVFPVPLEKHIPYVFIKHVPVQVPVKIHVPHPVPMPVPVPVPVPSPVIPKVVIHEYDDEECDWR